MISFNMIKIQIRGLLLLISIVIYFLLLYYMNGTIVFYKPSLASTLYGLEILVYLLFFLFLVLNPGFRFKFLYKLFILSSVWLFTAYYLDNVGNWSEYSLIMSSGLKAPWLLNVQTVFLAIYAIYAIYSNFNDPRVRCPHCRKLNDFEIEGHEAELLNMKTSKDLTHGRITNKGELDRRYNSEFEIVNTYYYKGVCSFCHNEFNFTKESSYSKSV